MTTTIVPLQPSPAWPHQRTLVVTSSRILVIRWAPASDIPPAFSRGRPQVRDALLRRLSAAHEAMSQMTREQLPEKGTKGKQK
jgi:hypothetical protein